MDHSEFDEADVEKELENVRKRNARLLDVDRPAQIGDQITLDFDGFVDGERFDGGRADNYELELGSNSFVPGFEDQLCGAVAGENRDVNVTFPSDYVPALAGKEAVFKCSIKAVREPSIEEAEVFLKKDRENDPKHVLHVANLFEIGHEEAKASFDLSNESEWPVFGLTSEMLPEIGRRIWSRDMKESGRVTSKSRRYCAACQRVHPYYHVRWEKGNYTKPCTAGIEPLPNGDFKII